MKKLLLPAAAILTIVIIFLFSGLTATRAGKPNDNSTPANSAKIQVAILLDVSNSMDGLIEQAKAQLWNMVSTLGKAKCDGKTPAIEIALYEYGRPENGERKGFIKQLSGFTTDLDKLSQTLFSLKTDGGDEYCGQVIYTSLDDLQWENSGSGYKVIFIAGNEDFLQGNVRFTLACAEAKKKGVIVNTIYCGDSMEGIREHWNLGSECGNGSYTSIDQDAETDDIPTPYDSLLLTLNSQLNETYISYGSNGAMAQSNQKKVDDQNYEMKKSAAIKRVTVKGKKELYKNSHWDIVDAAGDDKKFIDKLDVSSLPDSLQNKSRQEINQIIQEKKQQRTSIQSKIGSVSVEREAFLAAEKLKNKNSAGVATLESEIEKIIKEQASRFKMTIE